MPLHKCYNLCMSCTSPLYAWKTGHYTENGKDVLFVTRHKGAPSLIEVNKRFSGEFQLKAGDPFVKHGRLCVKMEIPCGHCEGCRLDHSRMWSQRCMLESLSYDCNWFITLTYDDLHIRDAKKDDFSAFMKRLRFEFGPGIRFYAVGELGERSGRYHVHAILFNLPLTDAELVNVNDGTYTSQTIYKLWPYGQHLLGSVTPESCAYVARYCMKKTGEDSLCWINMSRRPGIGASFLEEHLDEIYRTWKVYARFDKNHLTALPPRYFKKLLDKYGIDYTEKKLAAVRMSKVSILNDAKVHHDDSPDSYLARKRGENKNKKLRLQRRRTI